MNALLHAVRSGHGSQPVALLHGSFASARWWQPFSARLPAATFTSYAVDLPGCGASPRPAEAAAYRVPALATAVLDWLDAAELPPVHLIGHALGAATALECALRQPHRVQTLTLLSCPSPQGTPTPPEGYALLAAMRHDRKLLVQALASAMPACAPDPFFQQLVDDAQAQAETAFTATARALEEWRVPNELLRQVHLPVLLLWGERDHILPRQQQIDLLLALPGADNLEVLAGCGHSPMLEKPQAVAERWLTFVEQDFAGFTTIREQATDSGHAAP